MSKVDKKYVEHVVYLKGLHSFYPQSRQQLSSQLLETMREFNTFMASLNKYSMENQFTIKMDIKITRRCD